MSSLGCDDQGIHYCQSALYNSWDWCYCGTGAKGLDIWPKCDKSKKQRIELSESCYWGFAGFASSDSGGCFNWQCIG